jgi:uncharacterized protein (UPF0276 family)
MAATRPPVGFLEIHPENFLANPHAMELLIELSRHYPISVHSVGVSVGSATGLDRAHLRRVCALVDRINPLLISGHLAWSTHQGEFLNDLLPLPFNDEALQLVAAHIHEVQDALGRPYLLENPSSYVSFCASTMTEAEFLTELVNRTRCRLLCDVSNVYLSAHNIGYDAHRYLDSLPGEAIAEWHLGGFTPEPDEFSPDSEVWVDTHGAPIADRAWDLYAYAIRRFGARPALVEWDNQIPTLAALLHEASRADRVAAGAAVGEVPVASAR